MPSVFPFATNANTEPYTKPAVEETAAGALELVSYRKSDNARVRLAFIDDIGRVFICKPDAEHTAIPRNANGNWDHFEASGA